MKHTIAVFKNQFNEFLADKEQLLFFLIFPALAFLQINFMDLDYGMYPYHIVIAFGGMFSTAMLIMLVPPVIAEHRENGSLRFMVMSGIKPVSYLLGIVGFFVLVSLIATGAMAFMGDISGDALINFLIIVTLGVICSLLIGAVIGILSKNRQKAVGLSMPIGMGLAFLPMFAGQIEGVQAILERLYIGAIPSMLSHIHTGDFMGYLPTVLINMAVLVVAFGILYKIKGMKA